RTWLISSTVFGLSNSSWWSSGSPGARGASLLRLKHMPTFILVPPCTSRAAAVVVVGVRQHVQRQDRRASLRPLLLVALVVATAHRLVACDAVLVRHHRQGLPPCHPLVVLGHQHAAAALRQSADAPRLRRLDRRRPVLRLVAHDHPLIVPQDDGIFGGA